jgi:ABC-type Mn2+/Zn2+ transport system permease subunit
LIILEYLRDPLLAWPLVGRPLVVGAALVLMSAVVSVLVVLKRLSFAGQGISHSAFGGVGIAAVAGAFAAGGTLSTPVELAIVLVFCTLAAIATGLVADRRTVQVDTAIGLLLVGAMALGGVLVDLARHLAQARGVPPASRTWESILFGSMQVTSASDVWLSWSVAGVVLLALWLVRRPLLFWAFDEPTAVAFGVRTAWVRAGLMALLALVVVTSMKLAGVVPASALLVLPGAIALQCAQRLGAVLALALLAGLAGLLASMVLAVQLNLQLGPTLVLVLTAGFFGAWALRRRAGGE